MAQEKPDDTKEAIGDDKSQDSLVLAALLPPSCAGLPNHGIPEAAHVEASAELRERVSHFLDLKGKGIHFNESLAASHAFRNPSLVDNLVRRFALDEHGSSIPLARRPAIQRLADEHGGRWTGARLQTSRHEADEARRARQGAGQRREIEFARASLPDDLGPYKEVVVPLKSSVN